MSALVPILFLSLKTPPNPFQNISLNPKKIQPPGVRRGGWGRSVLHPPPPQKMQRLAKVFPYHHQISSKGIFGKGGFKLRVSRGGGKGKRRGGGGGGMGGFWIEM